MIRHWIRQRVDDGVPRKNIFGFLLTGKIGDGACVKASVVITWGDARDLMVNWERDHHLHVHRAVLLTTGFILFRGGPSTVKDESKPRMGMISMHMERDKASVSIEWQSNTARGQAWFSRWRPTASACHECHRTWWWLCRTQVCSVNDQLKKRKIKQRYSSWSRAYM